MLTQSIEIVALRVRCEAWNGSLENNENNPRMCSLSIEPFINSQHRAGRKKWTSAQRFFCIVWHRTNFYWDESENQTARKDWYFDDNEILDLNATPFCWIWCSKRKSTIPTQSECLQQIPWWLFSFTTSDYRHSWPDHTCTRYPHTIELQKHLIYSFHAHINTFATHQFRSSAFETFFHASHFFFCVMSMIRWMQRFR